MGQTHAKKFASEGANVVITDLNEEKGKEIAEEIGEKALFVKHNVTSEEDWENVVKQTEEKFGPVTGLVNNAGILEDPAPIEDQSAETFMKVFEINTLSAFLGIKTVAPSIKKNDKGSIVNISSISGLMGVPNQSTYVTSKFGLRGLTKTATH